MNEQKAALEDYPHILANLWRYWGHPQFFAYVDGLTTTDRPRQRQGFPLDVLEELIFLLDVHREVYPETRGLWDHESIYERLKEPGPT